MRGIRLATFSVMLIISNCFSASIQGIHNPGTGVLLHNVQVQHCPQACEFAGADTATWTTYHGFDELSLCDDTVLFTFNVHATTSDSLFKACSTATTGPRMQAGAYHGLVDNNITDAPTPDLIRQTISPDQSGILSTSSHNGSCGALPQQTTLQMDTRWSGTGTSSSNHVSIALSHLESYFRNSVGCGKALIFARSSVDVVVGAFVGGDVAKSTAADLLGDQAEILSKSFQGNLPARYAALTANPSSGNDSAFQTFFDTRFALSMDTSGDLSSVQTFFLDYIVNLDRGADFQQLGGAGSSKEVSVTVLASAVSSNVTVSSHQIEARALCRDIQVVKDDICSTLATKCGISGADFTKYNSKTPNLCSTLKANQYVCCSSGDLPDHTPQPGSDGICASYQVQPLDGCKVIADSFGINITRILEVNQRTWGFRGCGDGMLQKGQIICVSKGDPPMPAQDPTAICGPQVVGSQRPSSWNDVAKLNPCLLNACCDAWGQCGTTKEFCTISNIGGVPGTAEPGTNGCISKCGTEIVGNNDPPTTFARVGYFEGFNNERECLNMDITQMDLKKYTHIHFAFATISNVYTVSMTDAVKEQFEKMVQLDAQGAKKILSFGGWSFSTAHDTSPIFAQGVSSANRELFASNVVQFLIDKKLDGLDFDWEYPGATDIEGATPGSPQDGLNYYKFLQSVKNKLPSGKTMSIALPASYWYLRGFPVLKMAQVVDYFIYMTYDLHGQWDYGSKFSNSGCKTGNCLRSHINSTETDNALSMVTKAGVPANKIMVGVSSYGRSFKMVDSSCTGVMCKFSGSPKISNADPGYCTDTPGYISNAEIAELSENDEVEKWFDVESSSNILTFNGTWVAYMDDDQKDSRINWIKGLNFGGTTDWAVDLQEYHNSPNWTDGEDFDYPSFRCDKTYDNLDALEKDAGNFPENCAPLYTLLAMEQLLNDTLAKYDEVKNDYDGKFKYYEQYINDLVNPQLENWMAWSDKNEETKKGLGNQYFSCKYKQKGEDSWRYDGDCPPPPDIMNDGRQQFDPDVSFEIDYTLKDKDAFEEALEKELHIQADWIQYEDWNGYTRCEAGTGGGGSGPDAKFKGPPDNSTHDNSTHIMGIPCIHVEHLQKGFPRKKASITVTDPKDIMESAMPTIDSTRQQLKAGAMALIFGIYNATLDPADAATAMSTPVQMLAQAVASMEQVKDIGGDIEEEKKKEKILLIVSLVLMILPFVAEVSAELAGFVMVARFAFTIGEVGNAAMAVVDIIREPESAPFAVMGILAGAAAGKGAKGIEQTFADAAAARRLLKDPGAMGSRFKEIDDKLSKISSTCQKV